MEQFSSCSALLKEYLEEIGISLTADQLGQFRIYLEHLQYWNRAINLTAITNDEEIVIKHFVDSLAGLIGEEIPAGAKLLDVGTGAGFPGVPLKIARSDLHITLVEPVQKKVSFLYSLVGLLRLKDVRVYYGTFEQFIRGLGNDDLFDCITTRALKTDFILRESHRILANDGRVLVYMGHQLSLGVGGWSVVKEHAFDLPNLAGHRVISVLAKSGR